MRVLGSSVRMAIHQIQRQTDLEKRLQLLRRQIYGKNPDRSDEIRTSENRSSDTPISSAKPMLVDTTYLHHDLRKILTFSSVAIGIQVILFILLQNHILRINFF